MFDRVSQCGLSCPGTCSDPPASALEPPHTQPVLVSEKRMRPPALSPTLGEERAAEGHLHLRLGCCVAPGSGQACSPLRGRLPASLSGHLSLPGTQSDRRSCFLPLTLAEDSGACGAGVPMVVRGARTRSAGNRTATAPLLPERMQAGPAGHPMEPEPSSRGALSCIQPPSVCRTLQLMALSFLVRRLHLS